MTYLVLGGLAPIDLSMKTILYNPIFINPLAYFVFPLLYTMEPKTGNYIEYAMFSGTLTVWDLHDITNFKTFLNTNKIDLSEFSGKDIEIDLDTADGSVALGLWKLYNGNESRYNYLLLEDMSNLLLESGEPILLEIQ